MREIPLHTVPHDVPGSPQPVGLVYADVLRLVLVSPTRGQGISTADGLRGLDVAAVIRDAASNKRPSVILEEPDWAFLNSRVEAFTWGYFNEAIADLVRAVKNAPKVDPNAVRTDGPDA